MKRKLSALLSLVLAVVMVFPMGIGVAADDPVQLEPPTILSASTTSTLSASQSVTWANENAIPTVNIYPNEKLTLTFTATKVTSGECYINGGNENITASVIKKNNTSFEFTGNIANHETEVIFTFENANGTDTTGTTVRKIKLKCIPYVVPTPTFVSALVVDGLGVEANQEIKTNTRNPSISIIEGAKKTITFTTSELSTSTTDVTCDLSNSDHAVALCKKTGAKSFELTGNVEQTTDVVFRFKTTDANGIVSEEITKTISITCIPATIPAGSNKLAAEAEVRYNGANSDNPIDDAYTEFDAGDSISGAELKVTLSNNKDSEWSTAQVATSSVSVDDPSTLTYTDSATLKSVDRYVYFKSAVRSSYFTSDEDTKYAYARVFVTVKGATFEGLAVKPTASRNTTPFMYSQKPEIDLDYQIYTVDKWGNEVSIIPQKNLKYCYVIHTSTASEAISIAENYTKTVIERDYTPEHFKDYNSGENIYIVASYEGYTVAQQIYNTNKGVENSSHFFAFTEAKPESITIQRVNVESQAATKKYYEGETFGYGEYGFSGVTFRVVYNDKVNGNDNYLDFSDDDGVAELQKRGVLTISKFGKDSNISKFTISYTENGKTVYADYTAGTAPLGGVSVSKDAVVGLEIVNTPSKTTFTEGDALTFPGLKLKLVYESGRTITDTIDYDSSSIIMTPAKNSILGTTDKLVTFKYKLSTDTTDSRYAVTELPIKVNAKPVEPEPDPVITVTKVLLTEYYNTTKDYYIGEEFKFTGYAITIVKSDGSTVERDLSDCYNKKVNTRYYDNADDEFTTEMKGSLAVEFTLKSGSVNDSTNPLYTVYIPDIVVTKRPTLETITVSSSKSTYMEGESPRVCDFKIVASYDNKDTRVFEVAENVDGAKKTSYDVTESGIKRKVSITPTSVNADTKSLRITYSETLNGKTTSATYDYEITVTVPDVIMRYYDKDEKGYLTKPVEDFYDALEEAEKLMDSYSSAYSNRIPSLQLRRDVTMLSDFTTTESIDIDLNGHSITMIRGDISISSRAASDTEVSITNTDRTEGKLIYSTNDEDSVLIAYNDTYVIDADSTGDGKYDITITDTKNGKVSGPDEVTHGHDAQFTITPDEGYEIGSIKVNNKTVSIPKEGEKLTISDIQQKQTVTVTFKEKAWDCPFTDVYKSASYYKAIQFVYENELFQGTSATKFEPDTTMTRAMFVTVLGRLANVNVNNYSTMSFTDVKNSAATSWYVPYVEWAASIGLVEGYGNGKFGPDDPITHAQMYVLMQRYALLVEKLSTNATGTSIPANDVKDIPEWAVDAVRYAAKKDFLVLSSNRLTPNANAKRAELAVLLNDFCENVLGWDD